MYHLRRAISIAKYQRAKDIKASIERTKLKREQNRQKQMNKRPFMVRALIRYYISATNNEIKNHNGEFYKNYYTRRTNQDSQELKETTKTAMGWFKCVGPRTDIDNIKEQIAEKFEDRRGQRQGDFGNESTIDSIVIYEVVEMKRPRLETSKYEKFRK